MGLINEWWAQSRKGPWLWIVALLAGATLATFIWPTPYVYHTARAGYGAGSLVRVNRFDQSSAVLTPAGWEAQGKIAPPADLYFSFILGMMAVSFALGVYVTHDFMVWRGRLRDSSTSAAAPPRSAARS